MTAFAEYLEANSGPLALQLSSSKRSARITSATGAVYVATGLAESLTMFTEAAGVRRLWHEDVALLNRVHRAFLTELDWPRIYDARTVDRALAPAYRKDAPEGGQKLAALMTAYGAAPAAHREHATQIEWEASLWHARNEVGYPVDEARLARERQARHKELATLARLVGVDIRRADEAKAPFLDRLDVKYTRTSDYGWSQPRECDASAVSEENADLWAAYVAGHSTLKRVQILDGMHKRLGVDGRLRPQTQVNAARTGRVAMSDPAPMSWMREFRCLILTDNPRGTIVGVDHSNAEMKVLAHFLDDAEFTAKVDDGDIYQELADWAGVARKTAKVALIAYSYNQRVAGLADNILGGDVETARRLHKGIEALFPKIGQFREDMAKRAERGEQLTTILGRPLPTLTGGPGDGFGKAANLLIQGSARDFFGMAVRSAYSRGLDLYMPLHDELFVEAAPGKEKEVERELLAAMTIEIGRGLTLTGTPSTSRGRWAQA